MTDSASPDVAAKSGPRARTASPRPDEFARPRFWPATWPWSTAGLTIALILLLTLVRIGVLNAAFINLDGDEAQYWSWSRHLAFGYFTKPPLIAWIIRGTTTLCGDGEACVRLSSPLLHGGTALVIYAIARHLYGARIGFWAAITYATLPAVWFSSGLITTDVPLIFLWACALLALVEMITAKEEGRTSDAWRPAILGGIAIGLGLFAKYAMIYFLPCALFAALFVSEARRAIYSPAGAAMALIAFLVFAPNLVWNAQEGFATFHHTAANANWNGHLFNPGMLAGFLASQIGVFGPIMTVMFLLGLVTLRRRTAGGHQYADHLLLAFALPVFVVVLVQAFISRAHANWAAAAYVGVTIVTVAWIVRMPARRWLYAALVIHGISGIVLYSMITVPGAIETLGLENSFKQVRGWDKLAGEIMRRTQAARYGAIMTDDRLVTAELLYYAREAKLPIVMFDLDGKPDNEYELERPYTPSIKGPVLYVTARKGDLITSRFAKALTVTTFRMERGGVSHVDIRLMSLDGFKGRISGS